MTPSTSCGSVFWLVTPPHFSCRFRDVFTADQRLDSFSTQGAPWRRHRRRLSGCHAFARGDHSAARRKCPGGPGPDDLGPPALHPGGFRQGHSLLAASPGLKPRLNGVPLMEPRQRREDQHGVHRGPFGPGNSSKANDQAGQAGGPIGAPFGFHRPLFQRDEENPQLSLGSWEQSRAHATEEQRAGRWDRAGDDRE